MGKHHFVFTTPLDFAAAYAEYNAMNYDFVEFFKLFDYFIIRDIIKILVWQLSLAIY